MIRLARQDDTSAIKQIAADTELFPPDMLDDMIAGYLEQTTADIGFVAEQDGQAVAFGFCEPERMTEGTWNLLAIGVHPRKQGTGIGSEMMRDLEGRLRDQGQRILIVETMGTDEFNQTRQFYLKNGYAKEATIREFYEPGGDKVVFWKKL